MEQKAHKDYQPARSHTLMRLCIHEGPQPGVWETCCLPSICQPYSEVSAVLISEAEGRNIPVEPFIMFQYFTTTISGVPMYNQSARCYISHLSQLQPLVS